MKTLDSRHTEEAEASRAEFTFNHEPLPGQ